MNAKRRTKWLAGLLLLPTAFLWGRASLDRLHYANSDGISRSGIDTQRILRRYGSTNDVKEIRHWVLHGPSEALGTQMHMTLGEWAIEHQEQFVGILRSLSSKERDQFIVAFSASTNQGAPTHFESAFATNRSPLVKELLKEMAANKPQSWPTLTPQK